jgi:hypothetical protein
VNIEHSVRKSCQPIGHKKTRSAPLRVPKILQLFVVSLQRRCFIKLTKKSKKHKRNLETVSCSSLTYYPLSNQTVLSLIKIDVTVSWDFFTLVFFIKHLLLVPLDKPDIEFFQIFEELFEFVIESPVYSLPGSQDSPVYSSPGSCDSPVYSSPGSW